MTMNPSVPEKDDVVEQVDAAQVKFSMPVVMFTWEYLRAMIVHKLGRIPCLLFLYVLGNMNASTGTVYKFKVKTLAEWLGCDRQAIYIAMRQLRKAGLVALHLRFGTVSGKVLGKPPTRVLALYEVEQEKEDESPCGESSFYAPHALPVGSIHYTGVQTLIAGKTTGAWIRLVMAGALNIDMQTGELKEKRPQEWGDLAGIHRTWATKGFEHLNEIGFSQVKVDYDVVGRFPFVSLANGVFQIKRLADEDPRYRDDYKDDHKRKVVALYEAYGIEATGWAKEMIENAWRLLGDEVDKIIEKIRQRAIKEFGMGKDTAANITRWNILDGETLSIGEVLAGA